MAKEGDATMDNLGHLDYPHQSGSLLGCPACEAYCHCTEHHDEDCDHPHGDLLHHTARCVWLGHG
ncbi:hypothetical protein [Nonomuraea insulae]|uniref:Uncharacterized protein n=1 Tax=Nonomuraea insulae TaxID=1616787 RepID=A0ABW1DD70_9ACTN